MIDQNLIIVVPKSKPKLNVIGVNLNVFLTGTESPPISESWILGIPYPPIPSFFGLQFLLFCLRDLRDYYVDPSGESAMSLTSEVFFGLQFPSPVSVLFMVPT